MKEEIKHLRFLVKKSKELLEKQVAAYRQQHTYSGTIIGITFIFIPFFISGVQDSLMIIRLISIIPILLFFYGLLLLLSIFRAQSLGQAFVMDEFEELVKKTYKDTLLYFIEANTRSYRQNKIIVERANKRYDTGIRLTIVATLFSIVLLLITTFGKIPRTPVKVPAALEKTE
jgi:hypothetical protein